MADLDDPKRLDRLGVHLTDTSRDEILDKLVQEVADQCKTPAAIVTIVMEHIQLFRASVGLPADLDLSRATARVHSFCQVVVEKERELLVTDAATDERVPHELIEPYSVRAYAGVPLRHGGQIIGSLCAIDSKPRAWDQATVRSLEAIAAEVVRRLDTLAERVDQEEPVAMDRMTLRATLHSIARDAHAAEPLADEQLALLSEDAWKRGETGKLGAIHRRLLETTAAMRHAALRAASALEIRRRTGPDETTSALQVEARALIRALGELAPIVRLSDAIAANAVPQAELERNIKYLGEAKAAASQILASLKSLGDIAERAAKGLIASTLPPPV